MPSVSFVRPSPLFAAILFAALLPAQPVARRAVTETAAREIRYQEPPAPIAKILDATPMPLVTVSPDRRWLLLADRRSMPPIAELAERELRLGGLRIRPRTNAASRSQTLTGITLLRIADRTRRSVQTPAGARIVHVDWSPRGTRVAFTTVGPTGLALWVADTATGRVRRLTGPVLNGTTGVPCAWSGETRLVCRIVPAGRGPEPRDPGVPVGPIVQEAEGRVAPNRTYQDLLGSPHDEALFEHYLTSRVAYVSIDGTVRPIGPAGIHYDVDPSPDGRWLLVRTIRRPFSYVVPLTRFPYHMEVWDTAGRMVRRLAENELQEGVSTSFDAVVRGPRSFGWRADAPAVAFWSEALDEGDPRRKVAKRDRIRAIAAPFTGEPANLLDVEYRIDQVRWARADLALVREEWNRTRRERWWIVDPTRPGAAPRLLVDRSSEDRYNDPGQVLTAPGEHARPVLLLSRDSSAVFTAGAGASPEGDRPFLDRLDLRTGQRTRVWRSEPPYYEEVEAVLDNEGNRLVTRRESQTDPPNFFLRDLRANTITALTSFKDPAPEFAGVTSRIITYKRADGVTLSGRLFLPAGWDSTKGRLPFLLWAYPREFKTADAASQVQGSPHKFTRPTGTSHLFALTQGYGVLDGPAMPIIGEGDREPNDTYVQQLVASAKAAIDALVELGVADRDRIAVGGHSYGAFMTANLVGRSNLFRAGIARSGAYNRTLTPFGFQAEERTFWEAPETYMTMSPFARADSIRTPLLLIHGMADNNSGTFPEQTERFFAALKGHGATVRYVQLPHESHGYAARESVGHTLWEMMTWLDRWLRPEARPRAE